MSARLEMRLIRRADREDYPQTPLQPRGSVTRLTKDLPEDIVRVELGLRGLGRGRVAASGVTFACDGRRSVALDLERAVREVEDSSSVGQSLYERGVEPCGAGSCVFVRRKDWEPSERWLDVAIGSGFRLRMPVVLPLDQGHTVPAAARPLRQTVHYSVRDRATRLAAVLETWGTLAHFYPYFVDVEVDWPRELVKALDVAAIARSPDETLTVLARLVARLADSHGSVNHAGRRLTGIGPLALRQIEGRLIVTGGLEPYLQATPIGSEVLSLDGVPTDRAYKRMALEASAATESYRVYRTALLLNRGVAGATRRLEVRGSDGRVRDIVVPMLVRDKVEETIREARPKNGAQVAPGIYYFDIETIDDETWTSSLGELTRARGIVFDMRGYPSRGTWTQILSHLSETEMRSQLFDVPLVRATGTSGHERVWFTIRPSAPRLRAAIVFLADGRAASQADGVLQMVRDHHLGVVVGEPTAGTNGNPTTFTVAGGFEIRFTAMRALTSRGERTHGLGVAPDHRVRPTLAAIRAGRDEILEAGIRVANGAARQQAPPARTTPQEAPSIPAAPRRPRR